MRERMNSGFKSHSYSTPESLSQNKTEIQLLSGLQILTIKKHYIVITGNTP